MTVIMQVSFMAAELSYCKDEQNFPYKMTLDVKERI
jgi:hypothetical protein